MRAIGNNMDCLTLVGNPTTGQYIGKQGGSAVWVDKDPALEDAAYAGMLRWDGRTARIVLCDGTDGREVYVGPPIMDNGTCCRKTSYFKFRTKPLCIPAGGTSGQLLQYSCGRYTWVDAPTGCDCVGMEDLRFDVVQTDGPAPAPTQTITMQDCLCDGLQITDVILDGPVDVPIDGPGDNPLDGPVDLPLDGPVDAPLTVPN